MKSIRSDSGAIGLPLLVAFALEKLDDPLHDRDVPKDEIKRNSINSVSAISTSKNPSEESRKIEH